MLVCENHFSYIQSLISRKNCWNAIAYKDLVKNFGHFALVALNAIDVDLSFLFTCSIMTVKT
jgi:hypothetical protein